MFAVTRTLVKSYRDSRQQLAVEWAGRGERDLGQKRAPAAVDDFRTALSYSPDDSDYRLRLAEALVASDHPTEAEAHLLTLWTDEPGNGTVNLQLGRLALHRGDVVDAVRYYHAAIDGAWATDGPASRREARTELARALINAGRQQDAQAELIALAGDVGDNPAGLTSVAELMTKAGMDSRALATLQRVLTIAPDDQRAAALAGDTAFRLGDLAAARRYLAHAAANGPLPPQLEDELGLSARVLALDPFARGIPLRERARRTLKIFDIARQRLDACRAAATPDQAATFNDVSAAVDDVAPRLKRKAAEKDDDLVDEALDAAFRVEELPASACGDRSLDDRAIAQLARERQAR